VLSCRACLGERAGEQIGSDVVPDSSEHLTIQPESLSPSRPGCVRSATTPQNDAVRHVKARQKLPFGSGCLERIGCFVDEAQRAGAATKLLARQCSESHIEITQQRLRARRATKIVTAASRQVLRVGG